MDGRLPIRFWSKCTPEPNSGCWLWVGSLDTHGYSTFKINGKSRQGYKVAYEALVGAVPDGLVLDHRVCDNPLCVNPAHLTPCTQRENVLRGTGPSAAQARRDTCEKGHPLVCDKRRRRVCVVCRLEYARQWAQDNADVVAGYHEKRRQKRLARRAEYIAACEADGIKPRVRRLRKPA